MCWLRVLRIEGIDGLKNGKPSDLLVRQDALDCPKPFEKSPYHQIGIFMAGMTSDAVFDAPLVLRRPT